MWNSLFFTILYEKSLLFVRNFVFFVLLRIKPQSDKSLNRYNNHLHSVQTLCNCKVGREEKGVDRLECHALAGVGGGAVRAVVEKSSFYHTRHLRRTRIGGGNQFKGVLMVIKGETRGDKLSDSSPRLKKCLRRINDRAWKWRCDVVFLVWLGNLDEHEQLRGWK